VGSPTRAGPAGALVVLRLITSIATGATTASSRGRPSAARRHLWLLRMNPAARVDCMDVPAESVDAVTHDMKVFYKGYSGSCCDWIAGPVEWGGRAYVFACGGRPLPFRQPRKLPPWARRGSEEQPSRGDGPLKVAPRGSNGRLVARPVRRQRSSVKRHLPSGRSRA